MQVLRNHYKTIHGNIPKPTPLSHFNHNFLLYSTSPTPPTTFACYLVDSLGFSEKQSLTTSAKLTQYRKDLTETKVSDLTFFKKASYVISFLKSNGLEDTHIRKAVSKDPRILLAKVDKSLKPKFKALNDLGFSVTDLARLMPVIFRRCFDSTFSVLRDVMGSDENVVRVFKRLNSFNISGISQSLALNVALLEKYGIGKDKILKHIMQQPSVYLMKNEAFKETLVRVEEKWGILRHSSMYLYAVNALGCASKETLDSKCRVFRRFGWTEADVVSLVRNNPCFLMSSEARIEKALNFYMNEIGYMPDYLIKSPALLTSSLEKRVVPRLRVLQTLNEKGLLKRSYSLHYAVVLSESKFVEKFVQPFEKDMPGLGKAYETSKASAKVLPLQCRLPAKYMLKSGAAS